MLAGAGVVVYGEPAGPTAVRAVEATPAAAKAAAAARPAAAAQPAPAAAKAKPGAPALEKPSVEGIRNFTRVDATVGCAGATSSAALAELKRQGFAAVVNLRLASEPTADVYASMEAASRVGLRYIHLPFDSGKPDPAVADRFLAAVTDRANQPVFIHCGGGGRAGALWFVKRVVVDRWPEDRAMAEAEAIGLTNAALKTWLTEYVKTRGK
jgi:uncharacterized protein (TIGR01244 family)